MLTKMFLKLLLHSPMNLQAHIGTEHVLVYLLMGTTLGGTVFNSLLHQHSRFILILQELLVWKYT